MLLTWTLGMALVVPEPRYHVALLPLLVILAAVAIEKVTVVLDVGAGRGARLLPLIPLASVAGGLAIAATTISLTHGDYVAIPVQALVAFEAPIGGKITLGALEVTLQDVEVEESATGDIALTVDVAVRNAGLADVVVFEAQATVEDGEGNQYLPHAVDPALPLTSDLPPGAVLESSAVYSVPSDASGLEFVYTPLGIGVQGRWPFEEPVRPP